MVSRTLAKAFLDGCLLLLESFDLIVLGGIVCHCWLIEAGKQ